MHQRPRATYHHEFEEGEELEQIRIQNHVLLMQRMRGAAGETIPPLPIDRAPPLSPHARSHVSLVDRTRHEMSTSRAPFSIVFDVIRRVHPECFIGNILSLVRPTPYVRVSPRSEGSLIEALDLGDTQVIRLWQDSGFCACFSQRSMESVLGLR